NATASYDSDGRITAYSWDFGDSTPTDTGNLTTHAYASVGSYNVVLTVTDNESFTNRTSQTVVVQSAPPGPQPPIARFTVTPTPVDRGAAVTFNASSSVDPDGTIVSYASRSARRELTLNVGTAFVCPSPLFSGIWPYAILLVIILVAILLIALARRRRKPEEPRPPPP